MDIPYQILSILERNKKILKANVNDLSFMKENFVKRGIENIQQLTNNKENIEVKNEIENAVIGKTQYLENMELNDNKLREEITFTNLDRVKYHRNNILNSIIIKH